MRRCGLTLLLWLAAITTSHAADTVEQEIDHLLNGGGGGPHVGEESRSQSPQQQ